MARDCIAHSSFIATVCSVAYDILTTHNKECALQGGSEGVDGALVFHSTTSPHLDGSHKTIVSFPGLPHPMPGKEARARVSNVHAVHEVTCRGLEIVLPTHIS